LALVYYGYFSDKIFRSKREAQDRIYYRLGQLQPDQMGVQYQLLTQIEEQYGIWSGRSRSYMREFLETCFGPADLFSPLDF
jgi:hypothetical protein